MKSMIVRFVREDAGQDLIEYALIATFVSIVAVAGATLLGSALNTWYSTMAGEIPTPSIP
jgi:pilus assembly protein Flp/PilA